jgi:hypothetical protein
MSGERASAGRSALAEVEVRGMTREAFLVRAALAAAAAYGAAAAGPAVRRALAVEAGRREAVGDMGILNFALTLQFIEASFYEEAGLAAPLGVGGLLDEIASNEAEHVATLRRLIVDLGGRPVGPPEVFFGGAFRSRGSALEVAQDIEDTVVYTLVGVGREIISKEVLGRLSSLAQVEARHTALLRLRQGEDPAPQAFEDMLTIPQARDRLSPFVPGFV